MKYNVTVEFTDGLQRNKIEKWNNVEANSFNHAYDIAKKSYKLSGCKVLSVKIKEIKTLEITADELIGKIFRSAQQGLLPGNDKRRELELIKNMIQGYRDQ